MKPIIFDSQFHHEAIPAGFNTVKIRIDGGLKSRLAWLQEREAAWELIEKGMKIFWELDLGMLSGLKNPLTHAGQFMSLKLSVEHFRDTLWKEFQESTVGVSLYRGSVDFTDAYLWDQEQENNLKGWLEDKFGGVDELNREILQNVSQFSDALPQLLQKTEVGKQILELYCRDTVSEYLDLLAGKLPEGLPAFLMLDASSIADPVHAANLLSKVHFPHLLLAVKGPLWNVKEFSWEDKVFQSGYFGRSLPEKVDESVPRAALCLPTFSFYRPSQYGNLRDAMGKLLERQESYKLVPEEKLTEEWGGMDFLIAEPKKLTSQGIRMLQGFAAAGGRVVAIGEPAGLSGEMTFGDFIGEIS